MIKAYLWEIFVYFSKILNYLSKLKMELVVYGCAAEEHTQQTECEIFS